MRHVLLITSNICNSLYALFATVDLAVVPTKYRASAISGSAPTFLNSLYWWMLNMMMLNRYMDEVDGLSKFLIGWYQL